MSEDQEDLELAALERRLDDAFATTRPRSGFEDELWLRMQARRPFGTRLRDALTGLIGGIREVPAVPMAAAAAAVVVILGIAILAYSGLPHLGGGGASSSTAGLSAPEAAQAGPGTFGRLPAPALPSSTRTAVGPSNPSVLPAGGATDYAGPAQLTWSGQFAITISRAPVFRYFEPTANLADQFAVGLGAVLRSRPGGLLGSYEAADYTLEVRGTVQTPPQSPAYFVYSSPSMPAINAAGAGPADLASVFLAQHSLSPQWPYTAAVDTSGTLTRVILERQFDAPGYGLAQLVDSLGQPYGMEVDLDGSRVVHVAGIFPVAIDQADYRLLSADAAVRAAIGTGTAVPVTSTPAPSVQLTHVDLGYVLVPAGDHSFYEPVFLFSGTFSLNGTTYSKRVLVPAVDPSQRTQ